MLQKTVGHALRTSSTLYRAEQVAVLHCSCRRTVSRMHAARHHGGRTPSWWPHARRQGGAPVRLTGLPASPNHWAAANSASACRGAAPGARLAAEARTIAVALEARGAEVLVLRRQRQPCAGRGTPVSLECRGWGQASSAESAHHSQVDTASATCRHPWVC